MDGSIDLLQAALGLRALRHELIATNLANLETPGYGRLDVRFHEALARALERPRLALTTTDPRHSPGSGPSGAGTAVYVEPAVMRPDGNGVDVEREMAELTRNALEYAVISRLAGDALARVRTAVEGR